MNRRSLLKALGACVGIGAFSKTREAKGEGEHRCVCGRSVETDLDCTGDPANRCVVCGSWFCEKHGWDDLGGPICVWCDEETAEWEQTNPPVDEWVWVVYAGGCIGLGKLFKDGVWEHPNRIVIQTVTHWTRPVKPRPPCEED